MGVITRCDSGFLLSIILRFHPLRILLANFFLKLAVTTDLRSSALPARHPVRGRPTNTRARNRKEGKK